MRFLLVEAFMHASNVNKGCGSQGATLPFSTHSSTSSENQISVLVCKTATNACCGKLAWVFWSALTLELSEFASLFLKVRPRHQWVSCVYWCLQGSKHPNTGSWSLVANRTFPRTPQTCNLLAASQWFFTGFSCMRSHKLKD